MSISNPVFQGLLELLKVVGDHPDAMLDGAPLNAAFLKASKVLTENEQLGNDEPVAWLYVDEEGLETITRQPPDRVNRPQDYAITPLYEHASGGEKE